MTGSAGTDAHPGGVSDADLPLVDVMAVLIGDAFQGHDHQATPLIEGDGHCVPCWLTARNVAPAVLRTLRPLIAGEAVAAERARIADAVHELATNGLEGDLAASALIHVSQLIKDNEL